MDQETKIFSVDSSGSAETIHSERPESSADKMVVKPGKDGSSEYILPDGSRYFIDTTGHRLYDINGDQWIDVPEGQTASEYLHQQVLASENPQ